MIDEHDKNTLDVSEESEIVLGSGLLKIGSDPNKQILSNYIFSSNCNTIGNANINISNNSYYNKKVPKEFYGTLKSRNGKWVCKYFYHTKDVMRFIIFNKEIISNISIESKITESRKEYRVFFYVENENKLIV